MTVEERVPPAPREPVRGPRRPGRGRLVPVADGRAGAPAPARRAVVAPRWVRAAREVTAEILVSTVCLLVPLLLRTLPSGCNAADPSLHRPGGRASAGAPPGWVSRSAVRLWRLSAWRNARFDRVPTVLAAGRPVHAAATPGEEPQRPRPGSSPSERPGRDRGTGGPATALAVRDRAGPTALPHEPAGRGRRPTDAVHPVDVVYTWVDDTDPAWRARYAETLDAHGREGLARESAIPARFHNRDELRYSLRSLARFAPFVRNVYIVTAGQVPPWLDVDRPDVRIVPHEEILDADCLPTFNSHAIESALHRIEGLAEHYLYLNDDFFLGRECAPATFFTPDGQPRIFPDHRAMVPDGPCTPADRPVDSASKNTREIMAAEFGLPVKYKMLHAPYPQRRSILEEMEQHLPWAFKQTARNSFRHHTDVNIPSCLSHYYALARGTAVTGHVPATYINISNPWAQLKMRRLLQRADREVFCLNDCPMSARRRLLADASVRAFLEAYFPHPGPYERDQ